MEVATIASQASPMAANEPVGSSVTARMNPIVSRNFSRPSARWIGLSRAT